MGAAGRVPRGAPAGLWRVGRALASWAGAPKTRQLERLHFPVGGRRYRPALEDVVEFLITEGLAVPRDERWEDVLRAEREAFQRIQLHAAIRRDPDAGREVLKDLRIS